MANLKERISLLDRNIEQNKQKITAILSGESVFNKSARKMMLSTYRAEIARWREDMKDLRSRIRQGENPAPPSSSRAGLKAKQLQGERLLEDFTGHPAKNIDKFRKPQYDDVVIAFGECEGVLYKTVRDGETEHYIHKFRAKSRPLLAVSEDGKQLYLLGGRYLFTDKGIVDK